MKLFRLASASSLCVCISFLLAVEPAKPGIDDLVQKLGSRTFRERDEATKELWKYGEAARPALEKALLSTNPEVVMRAESVLAKFNWGITPNTSKELLALIDDFRDAMPTPQDRSASRRLLVIKDFMKLGPTALPTLRRILEQDFERQWPEERSIVFKNLTVIFREEVPRLMMAGKFSEAEALLHLNTLGPDTEGHMDFATYHAARGTSKEAAKDLERIRTMKGHTAEYATRALVVLAHANNESEKAQKISGELYLAQPSYQEYHEALLLDLHAWNDLLKIPLNGQYNSLDGLRAYRLKLAGKTAESEKVLEEIIESSPENDSFTSPDSGAVGLFLNNKPLEAIARMKSCQSAPHVVTDVYVSRFQFAEAQKTIELGMKDLQDNEESKRYEPTLGPLYRMKKAQLFAQLGQTQAAAQLFSAAAESVKHSDGFQVNQIVKAAVSAGRTVQAAEVLGNKLAEADEVNGRGGRQPGSNLRNYLGQEPFEVLFGADADAAKYWWAVLRKAEPTKSGGVHMVQIRDLIRNKLKPAEITAMIELTEKKQVQLMQAENPFQKAFALCEAYLRLDKPKDAISALQAAADALSKSDASKYSSTSRNWIFGLDEQFRLWMEHGDLLSDAGKHAEAARIYEQGWKRFPDNPILLYLAGRALIASGQEAEGKKRLELAHLVPLGNARLRGRFMDELVTRGASHATLKRELQELRRTIWIPDGNIGNVWNQVARASTTLRDYDTALESNMRSRYSFLHREGRVYVSGSGYLSVPLTEPIYLARKLLAEGKVAAALAKADEVLTVAPGNTELAIAMIPELDKLGKTKEAEALFRKVWNGYAEIIKQNPESAWAKNLAAWFAAACQRELPTALVYAEAAVKSDADARHYRDTLAEVQFRLKDRAQAVAIMKQLASEDRRNFHYRRQLERYKTGDFTSRLPLNEDD